MKQGKPATRTIRQSVTIRAAAAAVYEAPVDAGWKEFYWEPLKAWFRSR